MNLRSEGSKRIGFFVTYVMAKKTGHFFVEVLVRVNRYHCSLARKSCKKR